MTDIYMLFIKKIYMCLVYTSVPQTSHAKSQTAAR